MIGDQLISHLLLLSQALVKTVVKISRLLSTSNYRLQTIIGEESKREINLCKHLSIVCFFSFAFSRLLFRSVQRKFALQIAHIFDIRCCKLEPLTNTRILCATILDLLSCSTVEFLAIVDGRVLRNVVNDFGERV